MKEKLKLVMSRNDHNIAKFYCEGFHRQILFIPHIEISEEGVFIGRLGFGETPLYLDQDQQKEFHEFFRVNYEIISNYFSVFVGSEWGPIPRSVYDSVLTLDLTADEISLVRSKLEQYTYIYLIKDHRTGYIKIGRSDNPTDRIKQLIRQDTLLPNPNEFELLYAWSDYPYMEAVWHKQFTNKRMRGEWFALDQEDVKEITRNYYSEIDIVIGKSEYQICELEPIQQMLEQEQQA